MEVAAANKDDENWRFKRTKSTTDEWDVEGKPLSTLSIIAITVGITIVLLLGIILIVVSSTLATFSHNSDNHTINLPGLGRILDTVSKDTEDTFPANFY